MLDAGLVAESEKRGSFSGPDGPDRPELPGSGDTRGIYYKITGAGEKALEAKWSATVTWLN